MIAIMMGMRATIRVYASPEAKLKIQSLLIFAQKAWKAWKLLPATCRTPVDLECSAFIGGVCLFVAIALLPLLLPASLPLAPRAGLDNILARAAPPSLTYWLHQLLGGSLLGLAQAATENRQQVKPDIGVAAQ